MLLMIFISGHTPRNVETKLTLGPFHSITLTRLTQTKGLTAGVACRPPPPSRPSGGGAVQEHDYGRTTSPNIL